MVDMILFTLLCLIIWGVIEGVGVLRRQTKHNESFVLEQNLGDLIEWGPPGTGKVFPAVRLECDVCGAWAPDTTCSDCVTWAEVQVIHYEKKLPSFELALREHKRLVDSAGW